MSLTSPATSSITGLSSASRIEPQTTSIVRLAYSSQRDLRKPSEKISQLGRRFSTAILPVYSSYTDARWSNETPSPSFISSSLFIGSLPRASARLTTTRSTFAAADDGRNVVERADHAGIDDRLPDLRRIRIDEADDADAQFLAAFVQLARQRDGGVVGAHQQQPLARRDPLVEPGEQQAATTP